MSSLFWSLLVEMSRFNPFTPKSDDLQIAHCSSSYISYFIISSKNFAFHLKEFEAGDEFS